MLSEHRPFHFCPRCRSAEFNLQSEKMWQCDDCNFSFYTNAGAAVAGLLEDRGGRLLLTRRRHDPAAGMLDLPGGFVDPGESAEEALRREIHEELGLRVTHLAYFTSFPNRYRFRDVTYDTLDLAFRVRIDSFTALTARDDVSEALFLEPRQIDLAAFGLPSIRRVIRAWLATIGKASGAA